MDAALQLPGSYGLNGRVVTMDAARRVVERATLYVEGPTIGAIVAAGDDVPERFTNAPVIGSGGTIYPGLIELHNHLAYNALPLWQVPQQFANRDGWQDGANRLTYRKLISGPMGILGRTPGLVEAVVRYTEAKCLLAGTTTSQGIALYSNQGTQKLYEGTVRNVERPGSLGVPAAATRISDVDASDREAFLRRLETSTCLLLHLAEGVDDVARGHFLALRGDDGAWAVTGALAAIHCVPLRAADFAILATRGASAVWSPLSNLLLYGGTTDVAAARGAGVNVCLGSDWSPSGSRNLLGELKVARAVDSTGQIFDDAELVAMVTRNPAKALGWDAVLGSLEVGKRADLVVLSGRTADPYRQMIKATETAVRLVAIDGIPRTGVPSLMERFALPAIEPWRIGRAERHLYLTEQGANPVVGALSLRDARDRLADGLARLPDLARALEIPSAGLAEAMVAGVGTRWNLLLDHEEPAGLAVRPHLTAADGRPTGMLALDLAVEATPLSALVEPMELDPLTAAEDGRYVGRLQAQPNLPSPVKQELAELYG